MVSPDGQARLLQTDMIQRVTYTLNREGTRVFVDVPSQAEFDRHDDLRLIVNADESLQEEFYDRESGQMKLGALWTLESK